MMAETLARMGSLENGAKKAVPATAEVERAAVRELVKAARARGEDLTGPEGLLKSITKTVLESALEEEMAEHVGYDKHAVEGRNHANSRNGTRAKTVLTDNAGPVLIEVPRDREGTFAPVIVAKRQRRLSDVDAMVLPLYSRGLTTGEISAHFAEVYGASVSKDTVSRITDKVLEDMQAWSARPLAPVYARGVHRRPLRHGPRREGRHPAVLRRDRGRPGRPARRARPVGRGRRRGVRQASPDEHSLGVCSARSSTALPAVRRRRLGGRDECRGDRCRSAQAVEHH